MHLTEFGIQSTPDKISGVSLSKQAAYLAIAEHMAYVNPRVAAFSQYLMSDDCVERRIQYHARNCLDSRPIYRNSGR